MTRARTAAAAIAAVAPHLHAAPLEPLHAVPPTPEWLSHHDADRRYLIGNTTAWRTVPRYRQLFEEGRIDVAGLAACARWITDHSLSLGVRIGERTGNGELCKEDVIVAALARRRRVTDALGDGVRRLLDRLLVWDHGWTAIGRALSQPDNGRGVQAAKRYCCAAIEGLAQFYDGTRVVAFVQPPIVH